MPKQYFLSICVPTYNRRRHLQKFLDSLVAQKGFTDEISIVINDGPSSDGTFEMVQDYLAKFPNISYHRNEQAVGMMPAILEAISYSNGKYTWLFGSDDFFHEDALEIVMEELKKSSPKLLLSTRYSFDKIEDCVRYVSEDKKVLEFNGFADFGTYLWLSWKQRYEDKKNFLTFMSVFCFDTEYFKESQDFLESDVYDKKLVTYHYFNFILIMYSRMFAGSKIKLVERPHLVFCFEENHDWHPVPKIASDLRLLCNYVKKTYPMSDSAKSFIRALVLEWWIGCTVLPPFKSFLIKTGMFAFLCRMWRRLFA